MLNPSGAPRPQDIHFLLKRILKKFIPTGRTFHFAYKYAICRQKKCKKDKKSTTILVPGCQENIGACMKQTHNQKFSSKKNRSTAGKKNTDFAKIEIQKKPTKQHVCVPSCFTPHNRHGVALWAGKGWLYGPARGKACGGRSIFGVGSAVAHPHQTTP